MSAIEKPLLASIISITTVLIFPVLLILIFWPLGLTGLWLNLPGTALLSRGTFGDHSAEDPPAASKIKIAAFSGTGSVLK